MECCYCRQLAALLGRWPFAALPLGPFPSIGGDARRPLTTFLAVLALSFILCFPSLALAPPLCPQRPW